MSKKTHPIEDITLYGESLKSTIAVCCNYAGARYHFWLDPDTLQPGSDEILFKNPPIGTKTDGPGYFATRMLDQGKGVGKILVPAMMAKVPELYTILAKSLNDKRAAQQADLREAARNYRIREAAPELLAALVEAKTWLSGWASAEPYLTIIDKALDKALGPAVDAEFTEKKA